MSYERQPEPEDCCQSCGAPNENSSRLRAANAGLLAALLCTLALIRKAQDTLSAHLQPDSSGDDREVMETLLEMFDGPEQRAIETKARAAIAKAEKEGA